jgi:cytochrome c oxidase subunit IV
MPEKVVLLPVYFTVFAVLLILTYVTYRVAFIDLGPFNVVVALAIAVCKMILVALYFMHLRYSTQLTWVVAGGGALWLAILIALTLSDYLTRVGNVAPGQ